MKHLFRLDLLVLLGQAKRTKTGHNFYPQFPYTLYMTIEERYSDFTNEQLIRIIELPFDYTPEAVEIAQRVLRRRKLLPTSLKKLAANFWQAYCTTHFKKIRSESVPPSSQYLSAEEMQVVIQKAYEYHQDRRQLFEIDMTKYWTPI